MGHFKKKGLMFLQTVKLPRIRAIKDKKSESTKDFICIMN